MYLNFPEFWRVGVVLGSVSGKGAIRLRNVWVRSWVAVFFLFNRKTLKWQVKTFFPSVLQMAPAVYKSDNCRTPGCSSANKTNSYPGPGVVKGRRRRFRLVSEQKKTVEREFRFWPRLDYQPLFGKMSPRSSPRRMKEDERRDPGDGGNQRKSSLSF